MDGDDRVRYCPECKLNVYNFSKMSEAEIQALVAARTGRLCARFYQRADGTMLTKNCPVGFRGAMLRATRLASATLTTVLALTQAKSVSAQSPSNASLIQIQSSEKTLTIEVVDPTGAVIPKAVISLNTNPSEKPQKWITNEFGRAQLAGLPLGSQDIFVTSPGFATRTVHLQAPAGGFLTVRLDLGLMGEVVEVMPEIERVTTPAHLTLAAQPDLPNISKPAEHQNALARFFSKLRHIF